MKDFKTSQLLFVYGTLLDPVNEFAVYLQSNSCYHDSGKLRGALYNIGSYPGALHNEHAHTFIYGIILRLTSGEVLSLLDQYEGFGTGQIEPDEFIRKLIFVETGEQTVQCWAYLYNWPVDGLKRIESGSYLNARV